MLRFVFDYETNGLLHKLDAVHSLAVEDIDSGDIAKQLNVMDTNQ